MNKTPHRFFRAMVLMSSGVALGCGGVSSRDGDDQPSPSGESGSSSGGATSTGGSAATAGNTTTGGVGSAAAGSASLAGSAGTTVADPPPFACPPAQLDCTTVNLNCGPSSGDAGYGWDLQNACACDPARPTAPTDCDANETLTCRNATTFNGAALAQAIAFECSCVPTQDYCAQACNLLLPRSSGVAGYESTCNEDSNPILCGCAFVYLK
jgi:hypothetical protein